MSCTGSPTELHTCDSSRLLARILTRTPFPASGPTRWPPRQGGADAGTPTPTDYMELDSNIRRSRAGVKQYPRVTSRCNGRTRGPQTRAMARFDSAASPSPKPTRARYGVVGFAVALAVIQYIDRVCISQAAPLVSEDLGLSPRQMGYVFSAFTLAYALFEIPAGYLGDRIGPRKVLLRIVLWWSFFTVATGWAWNWLSLVTTRFLFGAGEAGCFPNIAKALHRWLPLHQRTRAQGLLAMSARWGGASTPLLVYYCLQHLHWRTAFLLFGLLGVAWPPPSSPGTATIPARTRPSTPPRPRSSRWAPPRPRAISACRGGRGCGRGPCGACAGSTPP